MSHHDSNSTVVNNPARDMTDATNPTSPAAGANNNPYAATHKVYNIEELLSHIALQLSPLNILVAKAVTKKVKRIIEGSTELTNKINGRDAVLSTESYEKNKRVTMNPALFSKPNKTEGNKKDGVLEGLRWKRQPSTSPTFERNRNFVAGKINLRAIHKNSSCHPLIVSDSPAGVLHVSTSFNSLLIGHGPILFKSYDVSTQPLTLGMIFEHAKEMMEIENRDSEIRGWGFEVKWAGTFSIVFPEAVEIVLPK